MRSIFYVPLCQAHETQEKNELTQKLEQTEARLNIQISSLKENLECARKDAEKAEKRKCEAEEKVKAAQNDSNDLRGEIAGWYSFILFAPINTSVNLSSPSSHTSKLYRRTTAPTCAKR